MTDGGGGLLEISGIAEDRRRGRACSAAGIDERNDLSESHNLSCARLAGLHRAKIDVRIGAVILAARGY